MFINTGKYLRAKRLEAGLTQVDLQAYLGYKGRNGFVSRVELGSAMYGVKSLRKIIKKLDASPDYIIEMYCRDLVSTAIKKLSRAIKKTA